MASRVITSSSVGLDGRRVDVECDISPGLPAFCIVGLPDTAVQEARERVKSAMRHSDLPFPRTKVTINLAPADVRKAGTHFDLPIAVAVLIAHGDLPAHDPVERIFIGELALDGRLRSVPGTLSTALMASECGARELIVPVENAREASLVPNLRVIPASTLREVVEHLAGIRQIAPCEQAAPTFGISPYAFDFSAVRGQEHAKRALEVAAAGGHNILLHGPPGSGKTLLARSFPSILPPLRYEEALDVTRIHSVAGLLPRDGFVSTRPFRAPHHTASGVALIGGGTVPKPGEISLAHRGVLFLDELPEFSRAALENLRQPLEDGFVTVSRAHGSVVFPTRFVLVAAMNPCPCGYKTDPDQPCSCTPQQILSYGKRLSGPLLDRIDLLIEVPKVATEKLVELAPGESSETVRSRVETARERQVARYAEQKIFTNAELSSDHVRRLITLSKTARALLTRAIDTYRLSARSYFRIVRVAQTIADLNGDDTIEDTHLAEALQYRQKTG